MSENERRSLITDSIKKTSKYLETLQTEGIEKKKYSDYKSEKIRELETESRRLLSIEEYEKAVIVLKKLIFFDSESKI